MNKTPEYPHFDIQETSTPVPEFDPEKAMKLREAESIQEPETRFHVNPENYAIFSRQAGVRPDKFSGKDKEQTLSIDETLGAMVGCTAETIATLTGENGNIPPADHVIYLDKSARPVSWLVEEFWDDFTDAKKPETTYLAIDRRTWLKDYCHVDLLPNEYVENPDGSTRPANAKDFDEHFEEIPREVFARIRALFIEEGIEDEDVEKIFNTPTVLDGKNLTIIDEVSRSGATLHIAMRLLKAAVPELKSVNGHVFWHSSGRITDSGEMQMGNTPVWYPKDSDDWRGRGVKDINSQYFEEQYRNEPTNKNRARRFGSIVLGEPLTIEDPNAEPGQPSLRLKEEIEQMHLDYRNGHILPNLPSPSRARNVFAHMKQQLENYGVEFIPKDEAQDNPRAYINLINKRNQI